MSCRLSILNQELELRKDRNWKIARHTANTNLLKETQPKIQFSQNYYCLVQIIFNIYFGNY